MLDRIIHFSLQNRLLILIMAVLLTIAGIYTTEHIDVDVFPDLNAPTVVVMTEATGMAPEEVERLVTFPVETAVNGASDVRRVRSSSTTGFSVVWVEFDWGTDIYRDRQIVSEKLAEVGETLPPTCGRPTLGPQSSILGEVLIIGITSEETSMQDLRTLADWTIRPRLLSLGGVAQVTVLGGDIKEYQILLSPEKMRHCGVTLQEVMAAVEDMNRNSSGGTMYEHGNEYIIRGLLSTSDLESLGRIVVRMEGDVPVTLNSIAEIRTGAKTPKLGVASHEGKPAVLLTVTKQPDASTIGLTAKLDRTVEELKSQLPEDVTVSTDIFRQQNFIDSSIGNIKKSLYEGALFVVIVLFFFLMNVRTTLISLVTIPLSLLVTVLTLKFMGLTINTMSIGGMAIAIGALVDDAIVDVENVFRHLRANRKLPSDERKPVLDVVFHASREVRMPILNSTLIIVVSFVPLFFLTGMEGRMLKPLGIAFITALFASTLVALTLTPVLCSYLLGSDRSDKAGQDPLLVRWLHRVYNVVLEWVLKHKAVTFGSVLALFAVAIGVFLTLGSSFLPAFNEGSFTINVSTLPGISLEESDRIGRQAEQLLMTVPEIRTVARKTGRAELDEHALGVNVSEMEAPFELSGRSKNEVIAEVRAKLGTLPGVNVEIGQPISHRIDAMLSGTRANIAIKLFGADLNHLFMLAGRIKSEISEIPGIVDLNVEQQIERPQLQIVPRREMLAKYGVSPSEFTDMVEVYLAGRTVSQVYEGNQVFDLTVKASDDYRDNVEEIRNISVDAAGGKVPFSQIAEIRSAAGPNTINRENVSRKIVISANVADGDLQGAVNQIRKKIEENVQLPEGYHVEYGGQFESAQSATRTLLLTSMMAILVIFLLLYGQFKNIHQASAVLLNLPLALIGGVFAIFLSDRIISIPAIIGFISLFGIATRNGMLLVDRYNDLRAQGLSLHDAVMHGSMDRLNPILMTALTSALALIPLAIGGDLPGNEIQSPMAKVMLGGLLTSTMLNGFIIPIVYIWISRRSEKKSGRHAFIIAVVTFFGIAFPEHSYAQDIDSVLSEIEKNNTALQALRKQNEADKYGYRAERALEAPEVGFDYLWGSPADIGTRKDISVTQSVDLAAVSGARSRLGSAKSELSDAQYRMDRQQVLLEAKKLCIRLIYCNAMASELSSRLERSERVDKYYADMLARGEIDKIEANKAHMAYLSQKNAYARNEVERENLLAELCRMNGGEPVEFNAAEYPDTEMLPADFGTWYADVSERCPELAYARQNVEVEAGEMRNAKMSNFPSLSAGYMAELVKGSNFRGLTLGLSIPLWSARSRTRQANASYQAARLTEQDMSAQVYARLKSLYDRTCGLRDVAEDLYSSEQVSKESLALSEQKLQAGEMSLLENIMELSLYYGIADEAYAAGRDYHLSLAELFAWDL